LADDPQPEELREHLRAEPAPTVGSVLLRGGPDSVSLLRSHARRTHRLYCLDGAPLWGISVFVALDTDGPASREGLLANRLVTYPLVHAPTFGALAAAGFELIATFRRPHFTVRLSGDSTAETGRLLEALGRPEENPYNGQVRQLRGESPR
jgi:hypothetical protein